MHIRMLIPCTGKLPQANVCYQQQAPVTVCRRSPITRLAAVLSSRSAQPTQTQLTRPHTLLPHHHTYVTIGVFLCTFVLSLLRSLVCTLPPPALVLECCRPGVWAEQRADDGRRYYYNKFTNTSKWVLDEQEQQSLVPNLDSYNNGMVMPLQVGQCVTEQSTTRISVH